MKSLSWKIVEKHEKITLPTPPPPPKKRREKKKTKNEKRILQRLSLLTSMSPLRMPSKSEGLIQPSITNHPPKLTALTLELPCNPSTKQLQ